MCNLRAIRRMVLSYEIDFHETSSVYRPNKFKCACYSTNPNFGDRMSDFPLGLLIADLLVAAVPAATLGVAAAMATSAPSTHAHRSSSTSYTYTARTHSSSTASSSASSSSSADKPFARLREKHVREQHDDDDDDDANRAAENFEHEANMASIRIHSQAIWSSTNMTNRTAKESMVTLSTTLVVRLK